MDPAVIADAHRRSKSVFDLLHSEETMLWFRKGASPDARTETRSGRLPAGKPLALRAFAIAGLAFLLLNRRRATNQGF
jgi:hypothetical protein